MVVPALFANSMSQTAKTGALHFARFEPIKVYETSAEHVNPTTTLMVIADLVMINYCFINNFKKQLHRNIK